MSSLDDLFITAQAKHRNGDLAGASTLYQQIIAQDKQHPGALHMLGVIAQQKGNSALALSLMEATLALAPMTAMAWNNRALVLKSLHRTDEALESAKYALTLDANLSEGWETAGIIYMAQDNMPEALRHLYQAHKLQPINGNILANYATALLQAKDVASALKIADILERSDAAAGITTHAPTIGAVLKCAGYPARALPHFRAAVTALPQISDLRINAATALLQTGAWEEGWQIWETRDEVPSPIAHIPVWHGEKINHLLLYEDQGIGDAINMLRYIPLLGSRANRITLLTIPPLQKLLAANLPDVFITTEAPAKVDARMRLMSLPALFRTTPTTVPPQPPTKATASLRATWQTKLASTPSPRIGIIWAGNASNRKDAVRSVPFAQLRPLFARFAPHLVSLQRDASLGDLAELTASGIKNAAPDLHDFQDTAALMAELDLVISVDTAGAHLAATLGVPTWMLTYFDPDFRWLLGRADTPWYPTMRLYRQTKPHDWSSALTAIIADGTKLIAGDKSVLNAPTQTGLLLQEDPYAVKIIPD